MAKEGFYTEEKMAKKKKPIKRSVLLPNEKDGCEKCGLYKQTMLHNPKLKPYGSFRKEVLVIGEAVTAKDDYNGKPFSIKDDAWKVLHKAFQNCGWSLYRDCKIVNCIDCRSVKIVGEGHDSFITDKTPTKTEIRCCWNRKLSAIEKYKPKAVLLVGEKAISSWYSFDEDRNAFSEVSLSSWRGKIIKDRKLNIWVGHIYDPSYIIRGKDKYFNIYCKELRNFLKKVDEPLELEPMPKIHNLKKFEEVKKLLSRILREKGEICFDYETSSFRYFENQHELYLVSICYKGKTFVFPYDFPHKYKNNSRVAWWSRWERREIKNLLKRILEDPTITKVAQNIKHEIIASEYLVEDAKVRGAAFDTMIAHHVLDETAKTTGLKFQTFYHFGVYDYSREMKRYMVAERGEKNNFILAPTKEAFNYCGYDSAFTNRIKKIQRRQLKEQKLTKAYDLLHTGVIAYADIEQNGIKIDVTLAKKLKNQWDNRIVELKDSILNSKEARRFEKLKGRPMAYNKELSAADLRVLLFDILKIKPIKHTKTTWSVDKEVLTKIAARNKLEILDHELEIRILQKLSGTYLSQILDNEVNGFIYPNFNLHIPASYRSSSNDPNLQNQPKRYEAGKEIRRLFTTRFGQFGQLANPDYKAMEVRIIACVTKDPVLIDFIVSGNDPHAYWSEKIFSRIFSSKERTKELRQETKNKLVFPCFYGSFYKKTAPDLWEVLTDEERREWKNYNKFEQHIEDVEDDFWTMFKVTREWQNNYVNSYYKKGYIRDYAWGFIRRGYLDRTKIFNFPIQGPAFHCLQWSINEIWKQNFFNMKSLLCGEIHDELFWDNWRREFPVLKKKVDYIMTEKIREDNPWIIVPLETEWEIGPNWAEMKEVK